MAPLTKPPQAPRGTRRGPGQGALHLLGQRPAPGGPTLQAAGGATTSYHTYKPCIIHIHILCTRLHPHPHLTHQAQSTILHQHNLKRHAPSTSTSSYTLFIIHIHLNINLVIVHIHIIIQYPHQHLILHLSLYHHSHSALLFLKGVLICKVPDLLLSSDPEMISDL